MSVHQFKSLAPALAILTVALTGCGKSNSPAAAGGGVAGSGIVGLGQVSTAGCPSGGFAIPGGVPFTSNQLQINSANLMGFTTLGSGTGYGQGNVFSGTGIDGTMTVYIANQYSASGIINFGPSAAQLALSEMGAYGGGYTGGYYGGVGGYNGLGQAPGYVPPVCVTGVYLNLGFQVIPSNPGNPVVLYGTVTAGINNSFSIQTKPASAILNNGYNPGQYFPGGYGYPW